MSRRHEVGSEARKRLVSLCIACAAAPPVERSRYCLPCRKERKARTDAARFATDPAYRLKVKKAAQRWRAANRAQHRALNSAWAKAHPENCRERQRRYRERHADRLKAKGAARYARKRKSKPRTIPAAALAFPYLATARPEHADYLAINQLVPQAAPGREDWVQDMALAILEGRATLAALQADPRAVAKFGTRHRAASFEQSGHAVSLSQPRRDGRSWHDLLPAEAAP